MPNSFEKRELRAKFMLELLEKQGQLHRKEVLVKWIKADLPESGFNTMFYWLKKRGYIEKTESSVYHSAYCITKAGKRYLTGLRA